MSNTLTFDALKAAVVHVTIKTEYGRELTIPIRMLSVHEWERIGAEIPDPLVPRTLMNPDTGKPTENYADPDYVSAVFNARTERMCRRVVSALEGGGEIEIPGATLEEKAAALRDMDAGIIYALIKFLIGAVEKGKARITDLAETFHPISSSDAANL